MFDKRNYPEDHPSGLQRVNKKVIGMFKDEAGEKQIAEFVGLRCKLYAYKMDDIGCEGPGCTRIMVGKDTKCGGNKNCEEAKKCKGVKKRVVEKKTIVEDYKTCLFSGKESYRTVNVFRSRKNDIYTERLNKITLSANDDKRVANPHIGDRVLESEVS